MLFRSGRLFVAGLLSGKARPLEVQGPVFDPRPDPTARQVAYVSGRTLRVANLDGTSIEIAGDPSPTVSWGSADFIAAEEMGRSRGYWWSPNGDAIVCTRVDTAPVSTWYIANPGEPAQEPNAVRYPAAGTANADVTLHVVRPNATAVAVQWDREAFPYLATVSWPQPDRILLSVQSRDQRELQVLAADPATGATTVLVDDSDDAWVELVPGTPSQLADGRLVYCADRDGARRLMVGDTPLTPTDLQVRAVIGTSGNTITFIANPITDATVQHVWQWANGELHTFTSEAGVHSAAAGGPDHSVLVVRSATLTTHGATTRVINTSDPSAARTIASHTATPLVEPNVAIRFYGPRQIGRAHV